MSSACNSRPTDGHAVYNVAAARCQIVSLTTQRSAAAAATASAAEQLDRAALHPVFTI